jgi:hypothetical protein
MRQFSAVIPIKSRRKVHFGVDNKKVSVIRLFVSQHMIISDKTNAGTGPK